MSEPKFTSAAVIGSGSFGTAMAKLLAPKLESVLLIGRDQKTTETITREHRNPHYLSDVLLDENVHASCQIEDALAHPLVDMDHVIEQRARKSITAIFADEGEEAFREMETSLLEELNDPSAPRRIISTGGGVIGRERNRALLRHLGYVVWLHAPLAVILDRTGRNRDRPLLHTEDPVARVEALMAVRKPLYAETAHLQVDTSGLDAGELATGILESARYFFTGHL